jgi:hypothetical protein
MVRVVIEVTLHGAVTFSQFLLGVLEGATLRGRVVPLMTINGTALATTMCRLKADYIVTGLTPGASVNWDAAWGCETFVASSLLKYGGPNNTTVNDAFGAMVFQLWDPCPAYTPTSGTAPTSTMHVKLDTIDDFIDTEVAALTTNLATANANINTIDDFLDTEIAAIKAKTDQLTFTLANKVDSSIQAAGDFAQGAADKVWSTAARTLTSFGTLAADVWAVATRTLTAASDSSGITTLLSRLSAGRATNLDNLDAAVSTRLASAGYTTPPTAAAIRAEIDSNSVGLAAIFARTDVATSTRLASGSYTAPDNTGIAAIQVKTDNLPSDPADQSLIIAAATAIQADIAGLTPPDNAGIAAIQTKTDQLAFTGGNVNANMETVNGITLIGDGSGGDKFRV